jgi:hypothetical protein
VTRHANYTDGNQEREEREVKSVVEYSQKINTAAIEVSEGALRGGEMIQFRGHTTNFQKEVELMELGMLAIMAS